MLFKSCLCFLYFREHALFCSTVNAKSTRTLLVVRMYAYTVVRNAISCCGRADRQVGTHGGCGDAGRYGFRNAISCCGRADRHVGKHGGCGDAGRYVFRNALPGK